MGRQMFSRLAATVRRDGRLESLPLCALVSGSRGGKPDSHLEIVSGHHRVRAARAAEVTDIFVLVDVSGLTQDQIKAKQLAHNSIQGTDDTQLLARIYQSIQDVNARLEAFVDQSKLPGKIEPASVGGLDLGLDYRTALVVFLPYEKARFDRATEAVAKVLERELDTVYLADLGQLEIWKHLLKRLGKEYDVRALGTVLARLAAIVLRDLGEEENDVETVSLRDLLGTTYANKADAEKLSKLLADVPKRMRWKEVLRRLGVD
jgi:hypothetical protein